MSAAKTVSTTSHATVRLPRAERRAQIVRAAATTFLESGYEKASMEDVARSAGVTRLIVYRIFESKEALYLAVLTSVIDDLAAEFETRPVRVGETGRSVAEVLLGIARRQPDGFRLLWRHTSNQTEFHELFERFKEAATDFAIGLISAVDPNPVIVRWAAEALVSHVYESICLWLDDGDPALDEQFLRMLSDGLRAMVTVWVSAGPTRPS
ncbi:MAG: hypothetical protein JWM34_747 [Ilumatobacteraceae bacterium]|nr:hypothetical protein [Ilumatobacteraceae bacterium]